MTLKVVRLFVGRGCRSLVAGLCVRGRLGSLAIVLEGDLGGGLGFKLLFFFTIGELMKKVIISKSITRPNFCGTKFSRCF